MRKNVWSDRMHAEFQLNVAPQLPFWFTPGQFLGNIVMKRDGSHVKSFEVAVPNNKCLNVGKFGHFSDLPHHWITLNEDVTFLSTLKNFLFNVVSVSSVKCKSLRYICSVEKTM